MERKKKPKSRGNGQGTAYKRGDRWQAVVTRYENGRRIAKTKSGFLRKKDALDWCAQNATFADIGTNRTFAQVYNEWSDMHYQHITRNRMNSLTKAYSRCGMLYSMNFRDIGVRHIQAVIDDAPETYYLRRNVKDLIGSMSDYAITAGYATTNYASLVKLPSKKTPVKNPFSIQEIDNLWEAYHAGDDFAALPLILIYTGMRYGELATIKPENIHLEEGYMMGGIKTEAGKRGEILLLPVIRPLVEKYLLPDNSVAKYSSSTFSNRFKACLERCGCSEHTPHECRHTTATILAKAGVQPAIIKEIMRHTDYTQTLEYTHIDRGTKMEAITNALHTKHPECQ